MQTLPLLIFDETLRDGEQQAGVCFAPDQKLQLARRIAATGVHRIDLMPAVDRSEATVATTLARNGLAPLLSAATMVGPAHVDTARDCGLRRVILFYAVSDRLLLLRDPDVRRDPRMAGRTVDDGLPPATRQRVRDAMLGRVLESLHHARALGLAVDFAAEDASRADPDFLEQCLRAFGPWVEHFVLCDTVGVLTPAEAGPWLRRLRASAPETALGVHFHNDQGLALENTLEAIAAGATLVSGTFRGIGERAGNVALEQVLDGLRHRHGALVAGIDYDAVERLGAALDRLGLRPAAPYSRAALTHVSGIHVQALLQDPRSYSVFPGAPAYVAFGKLSGASNFQYLFERVLGQPQPPAVYRRLSAALKERAVREARCYTMDEVLAQLARDGLTARVA